MATTCKLIAKNVLGSDAANVEFTSIPATYDDLWLVFTVRSDRSGSYLDRVEATFNGSSANYSGRFLQGYGTSADSSTTASTYIYAGYSTAANATASTFASTEVYVPNYAGSTNKSVSVTSAQENNSATDNGLWISAHLWSVTDAITSVKVKPGIGSNWKSGSSFFLYGIKKA